MAAMAILITTSILSLRGLPSEAKYGVQSIFYYLFAAIVFLLPFSLVCAELASTYTRSGGLYRWVSEAFGPRWGWTAMYPEWQTVVIWCPTVLMFGAASLAYIFWPESFDASLASTLTIQVGPWLPACRARSRGCGGWCDLASRHRQTLTDSCRYAAAGTAVFRWIAREDPVEIFLTL